MANSWGKDGHVSCPAKEFERFNLNFLENAILKGILHVFNAKMIWKPLAQLDFLSLLIFFLKPFFHLFFCLTFYDYKTMQQTKGEIPFFLVRKH